MKKCEFCEKFDFATARTEVTKYGANILLTLCNTKFDKEVIGNIHDNSDLLKGE